MAMAGQFCIPADSSRLELILGDGHDFVARDEGTTDVLLIDDFNNDEEVHQMNSAEFFRSEEHTSELQSLMRISYAVFCLKKKNKKRNNTSEHIYLKITSTQNYDT